jgi:threonine dehydrogenase-like Zn-dependent dehydrogenase
VCWNNCVYSNDATQGVIGLGGLGHMAVKFGKAFGLNVTVLSTSESKRHEAISLLGADNFVISSETQQIEVLPWTLHNLNVPRHLDTSSVPKYETFYVCPKSKNSILDLVYRKNSIYNSKSVQLNLLWNVFGIVDVNIFVFKLGQS